MKPNDAQVVKLIRLGMMPAEAERIVAEAAAHDHQPWGEVEAARMSGVSKADIQNARVAWYGSDRIPPRWKRLLDATDANA